jgi:hypothetical protein
VYACVGERERGGEEEEKDGRGEREKEGGGGAKHETGKGTTLKDHLRKKETEEENVKEDLTSKNISAEALAQYGIWYISSLFTWFRA